MFDPTSRYYSIGNAVFTDRDGKNRLYKKRRFLPQVPETPAANEVRVRDADRLDLIAARRLYNATLSWRVADANQTLDPDELLKPVGRLLRLPDNVAP